MRKMRMRMPSVCLGLYIKRKIQQNLQSERNKRGKGLETVQGAKSS